MNNTGENCEKDGENMEERQVEKWKDLVNTEEHCEMIGKIWKKILKRYEQYGRKLWKEMENMEENSEKIWKILNKIVKR